MASVILSDFWNVAALPRRRGFGTMFSEAYDLNEHLLRYYESLKGRYTVALFTSVGRYDDPPIKDRMTALFSPIYRTSDDGLQKNDPKSYAEIARRIGKEPAEIVFVDDMTENIAAAKKAGCETVLFVDTLDAIRQIKERLEGEIGRRR